MPLLVQKFASEMARMCQAAGEAAAEGGGCVPEALFDRMKEKLMRQWANHRFYTPYQVRIFVFLFFPVISCEFSPRSFFPLHFRFNFLSLIGPLLTLIYFSHDSSFHFPLPRRARSTAPTPASA